jgi:hypothetical protein
VRSGAAAADDEDDDDEDDEEAERQRVLASEIKHSLTQILIEVTNEIFGGLRIEVGARITMV